MIVRVFWVLGAFASGAFVACASDTFGTAQPDASTISDSGNGADVEASTVVDSGPKVCTADCLGGACVDGICQPITLAKGLNGPYGIAVHGASVYVTEFVPHGRVLRFDKRAGANQVPQVVATEATVVTSLGVAYVTQPLSVAANNDVVVWTDVGTQPTTGSAKNFYASASDGGSPTPFYQLCGQGEITVDDTHFYWANQATPQCWRPEQNGLLSGGQFPVGHTGSVFFPIDAPDAGDAGAGLGLQTDGGPSVIPFAVAVDGNRVFVGAGKQLLILDADKVAGAPPPANPVVGSSTALSAAPYAIATDFDTVAWTDKQASGSVYILAKNVAANTTPLRLAKAQESPLGVTIDHATSYVYFTTYGDGKLRRARKDGSGPPEVVLSGLDHPAFLTSDTTALYFTNFGTGAADGTLMRVAKP